MKFGIKVKLIFIFIFIKIIPLIILLYISIFGITQLGLIFKEEATLTLKNSNELVKKTANVAIEDSIEALDKKSQESIEILTKHIASNVANFLYQRDKDILFLSNLNNLDQDILNNFYNSNTKNIIIPKQFKYDDQKGWIPKDKKIIQNKINKAHLKENQKYFNANNPKDFKTKALKIYKEISYFDLKGKEQLKVSSINNKLLDISKKQNTYIKAESYFKKIQKLKKGEIYVSNVIGEYVKSNIIGDFTKQKAKELDIKFNPQEHGYAGIENPVGKKFDGIIRFITPKYKNNKKIGYISLALDHRHIMEFTDYVVPTKEATLNYSDASHGNYAFMWDNKGRNISHPRDYFIVGYDKNTGKRVIPWLSLDLAQKLKNSNKSWESFLDNYPTFEKQSLKKKPNILQLKNQGNIALDCRYLNFAPQCNGWMQITKNGGYGSFVIFWSNVWKLNSVATIPYYTGDYKKSKRGFGFVTIGANLKEFHEPTNKTQKNIDKIVNKNLEKIKNISKKSESEIENYVKKIVHNLTSSTILMIIIVILIAIWIAKSITSSINKLIEGTEQFKQNNFDYKIKVNSKDEIGILANSFNTMANSIKELFKKQEKLNIELKKSQNKLKLLNENLEDKVKMELRKNKKIQDKLYQSEKLASMGEMIGNIAHQWRQPLSVISTSATGMKIKKEYSILEDDELYDICDIIDKNAQYLSQTIDDFRNFIKNDKNKVKFSIKYNLESFINIVDATLKTEHIQLISDLEDVELFSYPNELIQCYMNIFNNSKDALKTTTNKYIFINSKIENDNIIISFKDNANGIKEKIKEKIFEPYFTTKHQSQGTGLGLSMTYSIIVDRMKGSIEAHNTEYTYKDETFKGLEIIITLAIKPT